MDTVAYFLLAALLAGVIGYVVVRAIKADKTPAGGGDGGGVRQDNVKPK